MSRPALEHAPRRLEAGTRELDDRLLIACGLAWAAGLIHVLAAVQHVSEYVPFAVFFELLALAQFGWGVAIYRSASRRLLALGAAASLLVVAVWVVSRTAGVPLGPAPWTPEPVGLLDTVASADELVLALLVLFQLRPWNGRAARAVGVFAAGAGLCLILLSSLSLMGGHPGH